MYGIDKAIKMLTKKGVDYLNVWQGTKTTCCHFGTIVSLLLFFSSNLSLKDLVSS